MKVKGQRFGDRERDALGKRKPLLPSDRGEARYQTALDQDRNYREMVFASIAIAAFAASGFGHSAAVVGPVRNALFCVGSVGFALRAIALRNSPYSQEGGLTKGSLGRIVVGTILGFAVFGSVLGGGDRERFPCCSWLPLPYWWFRRPFGRSFGHSVTCQELVA